MAPKHACLIVKKLGAGLGTDCCWSIKPFTKHLDASRHSLPDETKHNMNYSQMTVGKFLKVVARVLKNNSPEIFSHVRQNWFKSRRSRIVPFYMPLCRRYLPRKNSELKRHLMFSSGSETKSAANFQQCTITWRVPPPPCGCRKRSTRIPPIASLIQHCF